MNDNTFQKYFQLIPKSLLKPSMALFLCISKMHHWQDDNYFWQDYTPYQQLKCCNIKRYILLYHVNFLHRKFRFFFFSYKITYIAKRKCIHNNLSTFKFFNINKVCFIKSNKSLDSQMCPSIFSYITTVFFFFPQHYTIRIRFLNNVKY